MARKTPIGSHDLWQARAAKEQHRGGEKETRFIANRPVNVLQCLLAGADRVARPCPIRCIYISLPSHSVVKRIIYSIITCEY